MDGLGDINPPVGKNNAGKTTVIEALTLLGQPCLVEDSLTVNALRGLARVAGDTEETFGLLFTDRCVDRPIRIAAVADDGTRRELAIRIGQGADLYPERHDRAEPSRTPAATALLQQKAVRFHYSEPAMPPCWAVAMVVLDEVRIVDSTALPDSWMTAHLTPERLTGGAPSLFSMLALEGRDREMLHGLAAVVPDVDRLEVLARAGEPTLYAGVAGGPLRPLALLGDGANRLASWLLTMLTSSGRMVLVDEIENGIHFGALASVWQAILTVAGARRNQLFATTHSYEALAALAEARRRMGDAAPSVRVIRLDRSDGTVKATTYDEELLDVAIDMKTEVR